MAKVRRLGISLIFDLKIKDSFLFGDLFHDLPYLCQGVFGHWQDQRQRRGAEGAAVEDARRRHPQAV